MYRDTEWWDPVAGVSHAERDWLEKKYPGWNDTYGRVWDVITDNVKHGRLDRLTPKVLPMMCSMAGFELTGVAGKHWKVEECMLDYEGQRYHFGTPVDKWIFEQDPVRYKGYKGFIDRIVDGTIPSGEGIFDYMSMSPAERGRCGTNFTWADDLKKLA